MPEQTTFTFDHHGPVKACLHISEYNNNGKLAVTALSWEEDGEYWERYATLSINTDHAMQDGQFVLNHDCNDFLPSLEAAGIIQRTGQTVSYGYVRDQPVCILTEQAKQYEYQDEE